MRIVGESIAAKRARAAKLEKSTAPMMTSGSARRAAGLLRSTRCAREAARAATAAALALPVAATDGVRVAGAIAGVAR